MHSSDSKLLPILCKFFIVFQLYSSKHMYSFQTHKIWATLDISDETMLTQFYFCSPAFDHSF